MTATQFNKLLSLVRSDNTAVSDIYREYYASTVAHLSMTFGRSLAEDCVQQFFLKLLSTEKFSYVSYPASWIFTCCSNLAKNALRSSQRELFTDDFTHFEPQDCVADSELFGDLHQQILSLDEQSQKIVRYIYWYGYSQQEVSVELNINASTVRQKHRRALIKLKKHL